MNVHLDTTYLLPLIGVKVKEISGEDFSGLFKGKFNLYINQISVFELCAKGAKYVAKGLLRVEEVVRGINAIVYGEEIRKIPFSETKTIELSFKVRRFLADYIDCIILSSAIAKCKALITEDEDVLALKNNKGFLELLRETNPDFKILSLRELTA